MYALTQYNGALETCLAEEEKKIKIKESELFKKYTEAGDSVNKAQTKIKYELAADESQIVYITRLVNSSWRFISAAQSRVKHLVEESKNQI
jgi:hypothetical protein